MCRTYCLYTHLYPNISQIYIEVITAQKLLFEMKDVTIFQSVGSYIHVYSTYAKVQLFVLTIT